jgi:hypothetical protein
VAGDPEFIHVLDELVRALEESTAANQAAVRRAREIQRDAASGKSVREIVLAEEPPLIVELTRANIERLYDVGGRLRRAEARALHEEGVTMDTIARLFGVTRQRVSALLKGTRS